MTQTRTGRALRIGDLVSVRPAFVPRGCTGSAETKGVVVSDDHEVFFPGWSTTARIAADRLMKRRGEPTADEAQAIREALGDSGE